MKHYTMLALALAGSFHAGGTTVGQPVWPALNFHQGPPGTAADPSAMEFVTIPAGEFMMGCSPGDSGCSAGEEPRHKVRIAKSFEIGKFEVTQAQWCAVMGGNPSYFKRADLPVERVSWVDVQTFLQRVNARSDGYRYRLPTEAEWEYAARAGSAGPYYGKPDEIAWHSGKWGVKTHPVGRKQPNAWGLYDMLGNVWEWVQDWYASSYYSSFSSSSPVVDPAGPPSGSFRVLRGGSWYDKSMYLRVSGRLYFKPDYKYVSIGFRCVREK